MTTPVEDFFGGPASPGGPGTAVTVPTDPPGRLRRELIAAAAVVVVVSALGFAMAELWRAVAPRTDIIRVDQGFIYANSEPEQPMAADGWFLVLGLAAGVVLAAIAWWGLRRYRGVPVLVGLVLGSLVGAWLAWWFGVRLEVEHFQAIRDSIPVGAHASAPLSLRVTDLNRTRLWPPEVTGVVAVQALAAAVAYTGLTGFAIDPDLRSPRRGTGVEPPAVAEPDQEPLVQDRQPAIQDPGPAVLDRTQVPLAQEHPAAPQEPSAAPQLGTQEPPVSPQAGTPEAGAQEPGTQEPPAADGRPLG